MEEINFINNFQTKKNLKIRRYIIFYIIFYQLIMLILSIISINKYLYLESLKKSLAGLTVKLNSYKAGNFGSKSDNLVNKKNDLVTSQNLIKKPEEQNLKHENKNSQKRDVLKNIQVNNSSSVSIVGGIARSNDIGVKEPILDKKSYKIEIKKRLLEIKNICKTPKKQTFVLINIYKLLGKNNFLQSIFIDNNGFSLSAEGNDEKNIKNVVKNISRIGFLKHVNIASITKNNDKFNFKINGEFKK